jgi:hypothetical protein
MEFQPINPGVWSGKVVGDAVEGVLVSIQENTKFKEGGKIYHLETKDGAQIVVFGTTVLSDRMSYIKIGEYVKIVYKGTANNKKGQPTKLFEVFKGKA